VLGVINTQTQVVKIGKGITSTRTKNCIFFDEVNMGTGLQPRRSLIDDEIKIRQRFVSPSNATAIYVGDVLVENTDGTVSPYSQAFQSIAMALTHTGTQSGTLGAGTMTYQCVAYNASGMVVGLSPEHSITLAAADSVSIAVTAVTGATNLELWRVGSTVAATPAPVRVWQLNANTTTAVVCDISAALGFSLTIPPGAAPKSAKYAGVATGIYDDIVQFGEIGLATGCIKPGAPILPAFTDGFVGCVDDFTVLYAVDSDALVNMESISSNCTIALGAGGNAVTGLSSHGMNSAYLSRIPSLPLKIWGADTGVTPYGGLASGIPNVSGFASRYPLANNTGGTVNGITANTSVPFTVLESGTGGGPTTATPYYYRLALYSGAGQTGATLYLSPEVAVQSLSGNQISAQFGTVPGTASYRIFGRTKGTANSVAAWKGDITVATATVLTQTIFDTNDTVAAVALPTDTNKLLVRLNHPTGVEAAGKN
jgi:hypothetical protein